MTTISLQKEISIEGKVVEISIREGKQILKLALTPTYLEIITDSITDVHLGEILSVKAQLQINKIQPEINSKEKLITN
ncbi:MAG: hypothetical protein M1495_21975 [Bacteroidetes bacterium]|nr:hypothetical protein [Bacteroidota bacterium]MCL6097755.1 hypothetical protein [Bacteroidota bacterium]